MNIAWQSVAREFQPDGALRDIYISETVSTDWQRVLDFVRLHGTSLDYRIDNEPVPMPLLIKDYFFTPDRPHGVLAFCFGGIHFATHFFAEDEIELDYWPSDIRSQERLDSLLGFAQRLGDLLAKPVRLTPENCFDIPFLLYQPTSREFSYTPSQFAENAGSFDSVPSTTTNLRTTA